MEKIKSGDIFVFHVDSKYGLIQVIQKSKLSGYSVRVFCDLTEDTDIKTIEDCIQLGDFYYLKNFYEYDLIHKSEYKISHRLPDGITMPKYMRNSERKTNGALFWYIIDVDTCEVVKEFKGFHDELVDLSPSSAWGIEYITRRWREGFSLKKWNDDLENKWYMDYLTMYEPDKANRVKLKRESITQEWARKKRFSATVISIVDELLEGFRRKIAMNAPNTYNLDESIKCLIEGLNAANNKYCFIETQEREELITYIHDILITYHCSDSSNCIDRFRQW